MIPSDQGLDVPKELETFFVWNSRERVIWEIISDVRMERRVRVPVPITHHACVSRLVSDESGFHGDLIVSVSGDFRSSFIENSETFI